MKKIFFTAFVAIVALGGALASGPYYLAGFSHPIFCTGNISDCATTNGYSQQTVVYEEANTPQGTLEGALRLANFESDFN